MHHVETGCIKLHDRGHVPFGAKPKGRGSLAPAILCADGGKMLGDRLSNHVDFSWTLRYGHVTLKITTIANIATDRL